MSIKVTKPAFLDYDLGKDKLVAKLEKKVDLIGKSLVVRTRYQLNGRVLQKRTGKLRDSIKYRKQRITDGIRLIVGSDVIYAPVHEYGLRAGRPPGFQMPKRPFLRRALIERKEMIRKHLKSFSARLLKRG